MRQIARFSISVTSRDHPEAPRSHSRSRATKGARERGTLLLDDVPHGRPTAPEEREAEPSGGWSEKDEP